MQLNPPSGLGATTCCPRLPAAPETSRRVTFLRGGAAERETSGRLRSIHPALKARASAVLVKMFSMWSLSFPRPSARSSCWASALQARSAARLPCQLPTPSRISSSAFSRERCALVFSKKTPGPWSSKVYASLAQMSAFLD